MVEHTLTIAMGVSLLTWYSIINHFSVDNPRWIQSQCSTDTQKVLKCPQDIFVYLFLCSKYHHISAQKQVVYLYAAYVCQCNM